MSATDSPVEAPGAGVRGLIFDKDGTLFDFNATWAAWLAGLIDELAEGDPARATALALELGFDLAGARFAATSPVIAGTSEVFDAAVLSVLPHMDPTDLRRRVLASTIGIHQVEATPLVPLLDRLRAAGLVLGLATNDAEVPARAHLERAGVIGHIAFIAGYDSGHGAKPEPGMLTAVSAATGVPPRDCAMIGDSTHDLDSGRAAGMRTVAVLTGIATRADLEPHADAVLETIGELPAWLGI
jgi:phosphoglycolate phosphatase